MSLIDPKIVTGNRAKTTEAQLDPKSEKGQVAKRLAAQSGDLLRPPGGKYVGSAVVHFYVVKEGHASGLIVSGTDEYATVQECYVETVHEGLADFGLKQLRKALMIAFRGRAPSEVKA